MDNLPEDAPTCSSEIEAIAGKIQFLQRFSDVNCKEDDDNKCSDDDFEAQLAKCLYNDIKTSVEELLNQEAIQDETECEEKDDDDGFGGNRNGIWFN